MLRSIVLMANGTRLGDWGFAEFTACNLCTLHPPLRSREAFNSVRSSHRETKDKQCAVFKYCGPLFLSVPFVKPLKCVLLKGVQESLFGIPRWPPPVPAC